MTGFFEFGWPERVLAISEITDIGVPGPKGKHGISHRAISRRDGPDWHASVHEVEMLMRRPVQLMPAGPGIELLRAWQEDGQTEIGTTPVVAWALCLDGDVRVVTPQGVNDGECARDGEIYISMPDGTVQSVGGHCDPVHFDNVAEYQGYQARLAEERAARDDATGPAA